MKKKTITLIFGICFAFFTSFSNAQTQADSAYVTFQVDMSTVSTSFTTPEVNGTFNSWCGSCWTMSDSNGDNIWDATGRVLKGTTYEFKFSADNWSIQENLFSGLPCVISQFGYTKEL